MVIYGFIVKVLIVCIIDTSIFCPESSAIATSSNEMLTRLISVGFSSYPYNGNDEKNPSDDPISGEESIKIENRQLYDTVKHASGYDPDAHNNSRFAIDDSNDKLNSSSTVKIFIPPRKSAVIQAIPRKVRGPGSVGVSSSTTTALPFARPPSLHEISKDYGSGEPTTTIVYATSIPTPASRNHVNIRPVPLLSGPKYRSTIVDNNKEIHQETENSKLVVEKVSVGQHHQKEQKNHVNVLEKPAFKIDTNLEQSTTAPRSYETTPYHIEQRKRNLYKSIPYARIRTNENIDEMPAYNRNTFVNPYPNHKWTNEDYVPNMPPSVPPQFVYENHQNPQQNYYHQPADQNLFSSRYPPPDEYQDDMYRGVHAPTPVYVPQQPSISNIISEQQQQQRQQYQPLTVRDFDLLLQLLVLRERRLHASQEPYHSSSDYSGDNNYYYDMPKAPVAESNYYKNREPKYIDSSMSRMGQPSSTRLLPSNVREELLFRMLLLALHLQPQPKPMTVTRNPPILSPKYMFIAPSSPSPSSAPSAASAFLGFRQRNGIPKSPVRSVQVLGEID